MVAGLAAERPGQSGRSRVVDQEAVDEWQV